VGSLPYTGYQEVDGDFKLVFPLEGNDRLVLAGQHVDQKKGPRTHSTVFAKSWRGTTAGSDFSRDIGQKRDLIYLGWRRGGSYEDAETSVTLSYQRFEEEENRVRSNSRRRIQKATVDQLGLQARHRMELGEGTLTLGFEGYHEGVDSSFRELNPDQSLRSTRPRGAVADEAVYDQLAFFGLYEHPLGHEVTGSLGLRFQYVEADADVVDIPGVSGGPFAPVHRSWSQVVGQASVVWKPEERFRVFGNLAQSFRAPNLSDLTRFDVALSGDLEIPSTSVDPEKFLTLEGGVRFDDGLRRFSVTAFHTWAKDLIQRRPTGNIVGGLTEVTKTNASDGYFVGFEAEGATNLDFAGLDSFEFFSQVDFVTALVDATDPSDPRRVRPKGLPPIKGQFGLRFLDLVNERLTAEIFFPWSAGLSSSEYNAAERRNTQRIPPDGLPAYLLMGIRGSYKISPMVRASLSIENIENRDYRVLDSGLNEAGTNVIFTFEARF
jgi:hemoglobin/transferrin/lactoferrin receptor protein